MCSRGWLFNTSYSNWLLTQNQNDTPLRNEKHAVGHVVLGPVLYIGAADYCAETGDEKLTKAIKA